jgi:hypothetical protein
MARSIDFFANQGFLAIDSVRVGGHSRVGATSESLSDVRVFYHARKARLMLQSVWVS